MKPRTVLKLSRIALWSMVAFTLVTIVIGGTLGSSTEHTPDVQAQDEGTPLESVDPGQDAPAETLVDGSKKEEVVEDPALQVEIEIQDVTPQGEGAVDDSAAQGDESPLGAEDSTRGEAVTPVVEASAVPYLQSTTDSDKLARLESKRAQDRDDWFGRLVSVLGIFGFIGIALLLSNAPRKVNWRTVVWGTVLQIVFAVFILWTPPGKMIFTGLNDAIMVLLGFTQEGTNFLFQTFGGGLSPAYVNVAFNVLPTIIFFSSLMTVLYHIGLMQWVVKGIAALMVRTMDTSGSETLSASANIFVGQTEAPLVVRPYVDSMTQSELMAVMTGGFATVAGGVMAAYVGILSSDFPDIAGHLIAASVMSAPAALVISKIMMPETEESATKGVVHFELEKETANVVDAAASGAGEGMKLALNVGAMLLAFIALVAMVNYVIGLPSLLRNEAEYEKVRDYLHASMLPIPEGCDDPAKAQLIACTHAALLVLAGAHQVMVPEDLSTLQGEERAQIGQVERLSSLVATKLATLERDSPILSTQAARDCRDNNNIEACGALVATTQNERWTTDFEALDMWPFISLELLLGWLFFPLAWLMGVPWEDCRLVGQLLGKKMVLNEFLAYLDLSSLMAEGKLHYRSIVISTYALCGFANFGSIAIQIGGIGSIAPRRRQDLARLGFKAMIAGSIAAFMTATIAGALVT